MVIRGKIKACTVLEMEVFKWKVCLDLSSDTTEAKGRNQRKCSCLHPLYNLHVGRTLNITIYSFLQASLFRGFITAIVLVVQ